MTSNSLPPSISAVEQMSEEINTNGHHRHEKNGEMKEQNGVGLLEHLSRNLCSSRPKCQDDAYSMEVSCIANKVI